MKREITTILASAVLFAASGFSAALQAQTAPAAGSAVAEMVPAQVALAQNLDANKAKPGDPIHTTLANKVTLKNGTVLPAGTAIFGTVASAAVAGGSRLEITFDKAVLKGGSSVAIKATIIGVTPPESQDINGRPIKPGDQDTAAWSQRPDAVDEIGALPGVDLHSKIGSATSGVLVASSAHDVKLKWGSGFSLAIAPGTQQRQGE